MPTKRWTDPVTGERFVEDIIDLPLSKLQYLKYIPHLVGTLLCMLLIQILILGILIMQYHSLDIIIKKHLYVVTWGADEGGKK